MPENSKIEALEQRIKELEEKIEYSKSNNEKEDKKASTTSKDISRRDFLKKAGLGAAGLGALLSLPSATAFDVKSENFEVFTSNTGDASGLKNNLSVEKNGDINLHDNKLLNVSSIDNSKTEISLIEVDKIDNLPDPSTISKPTIAYINNQDEYAGIFQQ